MSLRYVPTQDRRKGVRPWAFTLSLNPGELSKLSSKTRSPPLLIERHQVVVDVGELVDERAVHVAEAVREVGEALLDCHQPLNVNEEHVAILFYVAEPGRHELPPPAVPP